ncbi:NACHT domain-containing protein [Actinokineospora diospyrosa]|uniref:NACHT domain-containing protein n=1 Tax=Actinokineospora diospyrosa TaxID=103728 RepID=A0ABT1I7L1_9PSEU|nr:NACHT domain-containing protein [Actinokineospora diospyrosa]MCP2268620.1 NACHT domain-containing protein [Actinokineospora diospyrosa]
MDVLAVALITGIGFGGVATFFLFARKRKRPADTDTASPDEVFEREYLAHVRRGLRYIDLKGLQTLSHSSLELDQVYVDVGLVHRAPHQVRTDVLSRLPETVEGRFSLDHFLGTPEPCVLAVLGGPGSGKTTLLRKTARDTCEHGTPVLLFLRDHLREILAGTGLAEIVTARLARRGLDDPHGWVERKLASGRCVVLLDGLDEVARVQDRRSVSAWVEHQVASSPNNDFVLTSRPRGFLDAPVEGATALQVRPFTAAQVRDFIHGWYQATTRADDPGEAEDLLTRLDEAPALAELTVNPLLLTMIATVHQFRGALPGSRADLYKEICEVMLWHREEAKKLATPGNSRHKMVLLRSLAYLMMTNGVRKLAREVLLAEFTRLLRRLSTPLDAEGHLAQIVSDGLLVEWEREQFAFAHLTFQEYLAAAYIREKNLVDTLCYAVDDDWWRETTLLYVAGSDADPVVTACLISRTSAALGLALDCVAEGVELDERLHGELDAILRSAAVDKDLRDKVRRAMVTRLERSAVRTAGGSLVWRTPVAAGLYRLFDDSPAVVGRGDAPARGMSGAAAVRFTRALTGARLTPHEFRLAHDTELADPAVLPAVKPLVVWTAGTEVDSPRLWVPDEHPRLMSREEVVSAARADLSPARLLALLKWFVFARKPLSRHISHLEAAVGPGADGAVDWLVMCERWRPEEVIDGWFARLGGTMGAAFRGAIQHVPERFADRFGELFVAKLPETRWHTEAVPDPGELEPELDGLTVSGRTWAWVAHNDLRATLARWTTTDTLHDADAARLRLTALALTAEVHESQYPVLLRLAAAATLWDQWRTGERARTEMIILAADAPESLSARPPR